MSEKRLEKEHQCAAVGRLPDLRERRTLPEFAQMILDLDAQLKEGGEFERIEIDADYVNIYANATLYKIRAETDDEYNERIAKMQAAADERRQRELIRTKATLEKYGMSVPKELTDAIGS